MPLLIQCSRCHNLREEDKGYRYKTCPKCRTQKKQYDMKHKAEISQQYKKWKSKEGIPQQLAEYQKRWRKSNKDRINKYKRNKHANDIQYRLGCNLRARLRHALHNNTKIGSAIKDLGCSIFKLKLYLESKFKPGMTWDNYGKEWHIDHVIPLCRYDLTDREEFIEACHFTNLQPLWRQENLSKGGG